MSVRTPNELVERAMLWHTGRLPLHERLSFFDIHVTGKIIHGEVDEPTSFHTYACLDPASGTYVAMNVTGAQGLPVTALQIRDAINSFTPSKERVNEQSRIAKQYMPGSTDEKRWHTAVEQCRLLRLPVAFMAFGLTQRGQELVVYQRSMVLAPLLRVAATFIRAAPRINLN